MKKIENLGDYFKSELDDFEPELSFKEEYVIHKIQKHNKFYKFDPYHFNIYYAMVFMTSLVLNGVFVGHYLYRQSTNEQSTKSVTIDSIVNTEKSIVEESNFSKSNIKKGNVLNTEVLEPLKLNKPQNAKNNDDINSKTIASGNDLKVEPQTNLPVQQLKNEIIPIKESQPEIAKEAEIIKSEIKPIRKKVFIIKRDTIFKKDTLKVKRK